MKNIACILIAGILLLPALNRSEACTDFILPKSDGQPVVSVRTMDFSSTSMSYFICVPRNMSWEAFTPGKFWGGMKWKNDYGFIATDVANTPVTNRIFIDGMNEHGLSAATLWLDDAANPAPQKKNFGKTMSQLNVVAWILGKFKDVESVRAAFDKDDPDVYVFQMTIASIPFPAHVVVHDTSNNSIVLEWEKENTFRPVITSGSGYYYSLTNSTYHTYMDYLNSNPILKKLSAADPFNPVKGTYNVGGGSVSLRGDDDDIPRWLKGYFMMPVATPVAPYQCSVPWRVIQALRCMGQNDVFFGESYDKSGENAIFSPYAFTEWTLARDHGSRIFYYRCMKNQQVYTLKMDDYKDYMEKGKKVKQIAPLSTWFSDDSYSMGSEQIPAFRTAKGENAVRTTIDVPDDLLGREGLAFFYARRGDGSVAVWNGGAWMIRGSVGSEIVPFYRGPLRQIDVEAAIDGNADDWKDAEFYAGCGTSLAEMFIEGRCRKLKMGN